MYGWIFMFMIIEMHVPGFPLKKFMGIPACYIYNWIIGLWLMNIVISYLYYKFEEKREARKDAIKEVEKSLEGAEMPEQFRISLKKVLNNL